MNDLFGDSCPFWVFNQIPGYWQSSLKRCDPLILGALNSLKHWHYKHMTESDKDETFEEQELSMSDIQSQDIPLETRRLIELDRLHRIKQVITCQNEF